jgi:hypothetical protein
MCNTKLLLQLQTDRAKASAEAHAICERRWAHTSAHYVDGKPQGDGTMKGDGTMTRPCTKYASAGRGSAVSPGVKKATMHVVLAAVDDVMQHLLAELFRLRMRAVMIIAKALGVGDVGGGDMGFDDMGGVSVGGVGVGEALLSKGSTASAKEARSKGRLAHQPAVVIGFGQFKALLRRMRAILRAPSAPAPGVLKVPDPTSPKQCEKEEKEDREAEDALEGCVDHLAARLFGAIMRRQQRRELEEARLGRRHGHREQHSHAYHHRDRAHSSQYSSAEGAVSTSVSTSVAFADVAYVLLRQQLLLPLAHIISVEETAAAAVVEANTLSVSATTVPPAPAPAQSAKLPDAVCSANAEPSLSGGLGDANVDANGDDGSGVDMANFNANLAAISSMYNNISDAGTGSAVDMARYLDDQWQQHEGALEEDLEEMRWIVTMSRPAHLHTPSADRAHPQYGADRRTGGVATADFNRAAVDTAGDAAISAVDAVVSGSQGTPAASRHAPPPKSVTSVEGMDDITCVKSLRECTTQLYNALLQLRRRRHTREVKLQLDLRLHSGLMGAEQTPSAARRTNRRRSQTPSRLEKMVGRSEQRTSMRQTQRLREKQKMQRSAKLGSYGDHEEACLVQIVERTSWLYRATLHRHRRCHQRYLALSPAQAKMHALEKENALAQRWARVARARGLPTADPPAWEFDEHADARKETKQIIRDQWRPPSVERREQHQQHQQVLLGLQRQISLAYTQLVELQRTIAAEAAPAERARRACIGSVESDRWVHGAVRHALATALEDLRTRRLPELALQYTNALQAHRMLEHKWERDGVEGCAGLVVPPPPQLDPAGSGGGVLGCVLAPPPLAWTAMPCAFCTQQKLRRQWQEQQHKTRMRQQRQEQELHERTKEDPMLRLALQQQQQKQQQLEQQLGQKQMQGLERAKEKQQGGARGEGEGMSKEGQQEGQQEHAVKQEDGMRTRTSYPEAEVAAGCHRPGSVDMDVGPNRGGHYLGVDATQRTGRATATGQIVLTGAAQRVLSHFCDRIRRRVREELQKGAARGRGAASQEHEDDAHSGSIAMTPVAGGGLSSRRHRLGQQALMVVRWSDDTTAAGLLALREAVSVRKLGKQGVNITDVHGNTPLIVAAQNGRLNAARLFVRIGAHVNHQNHKGQTALHYAYAYGYDQIFWELRVEGKADDDLRNMHGKTCYDGVS